MSFSYVFYYYSLQFLTEKYTYLLVKREVVLKRVVVCTIRIAIDNIYIILHSHRFTYMLPGARGVADTCDQAQVPEPGKKKVMSTFRALKVTNNLQKSLE